MNRVTAIQVADLFLVYDSANKLLMCTVFGVDSVESSDMDFPYTCPNVTIGPTTMMLFGVPSISVKELFKSA